MTESSTPRADRAAVIDLGSNSIKLLVVERTEDGSLRELVQHTKETRLGTGITGQPPRLQDASITRAIESVQDLLATAAPFAAQQTQIVATSAVRDAANRTVFAARLQQATGHALRVVSGDEEARLIGRAISSEPSLRDQSAFYVFDLGGGSLELLAIERHEPVQVESLPLGCVRVTEHCVPDASLPISAELADAIRTRVRHAIDASTFRFNLPPGSLAIVTGGTATTVRMMRAAAWGRALVVESPVLALTELRRFAANVCELPLAERRRLPGLPEARADVFPAAILTLIELAHLAGCDALRHSLRSLRFGVAMELLGGRAAPA